MIWTTVPSPLGELLLVGDGELLSGLYMRGATHALEPRPEWAHEPNAYPEARRQLDEYFAGSRRDFDLRLAATGTPFQQRVWDTLRDIPYGETVSYAELARRVGSPAAVRAVGAANGRNPVCVIVPCHRVIGSNGSLTGYAGGVERKRLLLDLEGARVAD